MDNFKRFIKSQTIISLIFVVVLIVAAVTLRGFGIKVYLPVMLVALAIYTVLAIKNTIRYYKSGDKDASSEGEA